ncbi:hypothetical protein CANARDRAFT_210823 [[Candida] arabinofermentans NRRL YB-2248]|uniref:Alkyl transferase n=1 Tax=[Candida] arabinofermentans NRRL YB-2248 TaxID=983967 RepID=A0A1E4T6D8_9ASCO|nr:hypothetical protein CANARDRAFT_210823 [[Candida] arabinofermentans NRRL YB-2248]
MKTFNICTPLLQVSQVDSDRLNLSASLDRDSGGKNTTPTETTSLLSKEGSQYGMLSFIFSQLGNAPGIGFINGLAQDAMVEIIKTGPVPNHLSFVMDGNRRFAKQHDLKLQEGHLSGSEALASVLGCCFKIGVKQVTVYAFSIENFNRSQDEIDTIFDLLKSKLAYISYSGEFCEKSGVKIKIIGNRSLIPPDILKDLEEIERITANYGEHTLFVASPYTSRDDIVHSITQIVSKVKDGNLAIDDINEGEIEKNFYYEGEAEKVDIVVRTSGHTRLSDYMLWQCHQESVIEYSNVLWPNFRFYHTWWVIFKWSYYKNMILRDAETMQLKKISQEDAKKRYSDPIRNMDHPPYASVTK